MKIIENIKPKFHTVIGTKIENHYDININQYYDLISKIKSFKSLESIEKIIATICYQYGFQYYSLIAFMNHRIDNLDIHALSQGDMEFMLHYRNNRYLECDPMLRIAYERHIPFIWNAHEYKKYIERKILLKERKVIEYSIDFGMKQSFSFPFRMPRNAWGLLRLNRVSFKPMGAIESYQLMSELMLLCSIINKKYCDLLLPDETSFKNILSKKEIEIIHYSSDGMSTDEIAKELFISKHTVSTHIKNIRKKLNAKNITHAVKKSIDFGIIKI